MRGYGNNGAAMHGSHDRPPPHVAAHQPFVWLTRERLLTWGVTGFMLLAGAGWVLWPAKDRDLQDLKADVQQLDTRLTQAAGHMETLAAKIERGFDKIGDKIDKLQVGQQDNREEIIRLQTKPPKVEEPKPVVPVKRRTSAVKPEPKPAEPAGQVQAAQTRLPSILDAFKN
jgi:uncharacterized protein HemX